MKRLALSMTISGLLGIFFTGMPSPAHAVLIGACDVDLPGLCTKTVSLSGSALDISLTNTSPPANGGFITADAFDLAGDATVTGFSSTNASFSLFPAPPTSGGSFNVAPFGTREFLIGLTDQFQGGGNPNNGIGVGETATFSLTLGNLGSVSEESVFSSQVIRFRGFNDGDSDKDLVFATNGPSPVPEPASVVLMASGIVGLGLAGLFWQGKRQRNMGSVYKGVSRMLTIGFYAKAVFR